LHKKLIRLIVLMISSRISSWIKSTFDGETWMIAKFDDPED